MPKRRRDISATSQEKVESTDDDDHLSTCEPPKRRRVVRRKDFDRSARAAVSLTTPKVTNTAPSALQCSVADAAQRVLQALGCGFTESVYRDALAVELQRQNIDVLADREVVLPVHYEHRYVGHCRSDLILSCRESSSRGNVVVNTPPLVVECKCLNKSLNAPNAQQLLAYMRLKRAERGVLVNFDQRTPDMNGNVSRSAQEETASSTCIVVESNGKTHGDLVSCGHAHSVQVVYVHLKTPLSMKK